MTDEQQRMLQDMAEQQYADATAALIAVKAVVTLLQTMMKREMHLAAVLRDNGEPT